MITFFFAFDKQCRGLVNQPPFAISYPPQPIFILGLSTAKQSTIIPDDCLLIYLKLILPVADDNRSQRSLSVLSVEAC